MVRYRILGSVLAALAGVSEVSGAALHTRIELVSVSPAHSANFAGYDSEGARLANQGSSPGTRFTIVNDGASRLGILSEITVPGHGIVFLRDPRRINYIMLEPG